eukprot:4587846-Heterocapsa_arctica.AAC.1
MFEHAHARLGTGTRTVAHRRTAACFAWLSCARCPLGSADGFDPLARLKRFVFAKETREGVG